MQRRPGCHALSLGEESGGCETTDYCVILSLALILVVKFLGGGGTSSGFWKALVLETTLTSGGQVNTHTPSYAHFCRGDILQRELEQGYC
jgi:hypothetical protein